MEIIYENFQDIVAYSGLTTVFMLYFYKYYRGALNGCIYIYKIRQNTCKVDETITFCT